MSLELSLEQLAGYKGEGDSPVYFAVKGVVYDVTPAKNLYGPGKALGGVMKAVNRVIGVCIGVMCDWGEYAMCTCWI